MLQNNELLLIDYLDKNLSPEETAQVDSLIRNDKQVATEWEYLKMAVEAVELEAIREQVLNVRQSFKTHPAPVVKSSRAVLRNMYKTGLRIAAILILLLGISLFYKYNTVNNIFVYHQYFADYTLNTSRGENIQNALDEAYRNKNWNGVMAAFNQESVKTNKTYFLAGMAALELKKYPEAVSYFEFILDANAKSADRYFQDEAEYYLALAYLMNKQTDKGVSLLNKIRENKNHLYYPLARQISSTDLKIIELKGRK
jgi:tetratricopeptide (TPR) repeat protein